MGDKIRVFSFKNHNLRIQTAKKLYDVQIVNGKLPRLRYDQVVGTDEFWASGYPKDNIDIFLKKHNCRGVKKLIGIHEDFETLLIGGEVVVNPLRFRDIVGEIDAWSKAEQRLQEVRHSHQKKRSKNAFIN